MRSHAFRLGVAVALGTLVFAGVAYARNPHCAGGIQYVVGGMRDKDKGNLEAYHLKGLLWFDASRFENAIENFDLALDHDPHHKFANFYKSLCLFMQGVEARGRGADFSKVDSSGHPEPLSKEDERAQKDLYQEAARKYEDAAKAVDSYLKNWDKLSSDPAPQEADLKNWARSLRAMAKAEGEETEDARVYMRKVMGSSSPALSKKGAEEERGEDGLPVIHESDVPPNLRGLDLGTPGSKK